MYIERTLEKHILKLTKQFKVLLVTGARQVGKSTLLKHCDEKRNYVTLDDLDAIFKAEYSENSDELKLWSEVKNTKISDMSVEEQMIFLNNKQLA